MNYSNLKVSYVDHMGNDNRIVDVARQSFAKTDSVVRTTQQNESLINYLAKGKSSKDIKSEIKNILNCETEENAIELFNKISNKNVHWTPFAHTAITLQVKAPIPIRTQCFKHKQGLVENEESRRYISSTPEVFIPEFRSKPEGSIKQGSAGIHEANEYWKRQYIYQIQDAVDLYEKMIKDGVAPEQARFVLPQGVLVNWTWTGNLLAYANFYNKRADHHAQKEIQDLAQMVKDIVEPLFPLSWKALTE